MAEVVAKYTAIVYPANQNSDYGIPVVVYAVTKQNAIEKAADIGWSGRLDDVRVLVQGVEEVLIYDPVAHDSRSSND